MQRENRITQIILDRNFDLIRKHINEWEYTEFVKNAEHLNLDGFCVLYRNYYILLEKYLAKKLPLAEYDRRIQNYKYGILPNDRSGFFQGLLSTWGYRYCKLIVFPKLQVLEKDDVDRLISLDAQMLENPDNALLALIERTYPYVLDLDHRAGLVHLVDHMNHDMVRKLNIVIAYDESNLDKFGEDDGWFEAWEEQNAFLGETGRMMEKEFSEILGVPVEIGYWSVS